MGEAACVLFITIGHPGQLNPLLAIATSLHERCPGVDIHFASSSDVGSQVEQARLSFVPVWRSSKLPQDMVSCFNQSGVRSVEAMKRYAEWARSEENYDNAREVLIHVIETLRPTLIVSDVLSEAGMAAAREKNIPYFINSPLPPYTCFPDSLPRIFPPVGSGTSLYKNSVWHRLFDFAAALRYGIGLIREVVPIIEHQRSVKNIPRPEEFAQDAKLFLNNTSELLSDPRVNWPRDKIQWIGASLPTHDSDLLRPDHFNAIWLQNKAQDGAGLYDWIDRAAASSKPLVFLALGTLYQLDEERILTIYDALSSLPVKVLWKLSAKEQSVLMHRRPELDVQNFRLEAWLPSIPLILAHKGVELFINHAGGNSLHEGLFFGKPMVCLPAWMDCFDFAMRCQDIGAGVSIDTAPLLDGHQLRSAVERVLLDTESAPGYAANAQKVAMDLQLLGGSNEASAAIERWLAGSLVLGQTEGKVQNLNEKFLLPPNTAQLDLSCPV